MMNLDDYAFITKEQRACFLSHAYDTDKEVKVPNWKIM